MQKLAPGWFAVPQVLQITCAKPYNGDKSCLMFRVEHLTGNEDPLLPRLLRPCDQTGE
jgi:hypothetical protein